MIREFQRDRAKEYALGREPKHAAKLGGFPVVKDAHDYIGSHRLTEKWAYVAALPKAFRINLNGGAFK